MACCFTTGRRIELTKGGFVFCFLFFFFFFFLDVLVFLGGRFRAYSYFYFYRGEKLAGVFSFSFIIIDPSGWSKVLADTRLAGGDLVYFFFLDLLVNLIVNQLLPCLMIKYCRPFFKDVPGGQWGQARPRLPATHHPQLHPRPHRQCECHRMRS